MLKKIHIGKFIKSRVNETNMEVSRICNFFECNEDLIDKMYESDSLDSEKLLRWSKLLGYDFFRLYSQHLILYSPPSSADYLKIDKRQTSSLPQFRKNIYTREIIMFILELIESGEKTKQQVSIDYKIPKTTLYKWINKYKMNKTMGEEAEVL